MTDRPLPRRKTIAGIPFILDAFGTYVPENSETSVRRIRIRKSSDCLPFLIPLRRAKCEVFAVITLDGSHQVIKTHEVTKGLVNQSQVHPREIFHVAIQDLSVGVILAHNHPSGSLAPSSNDLVTTRRLSEAGRIIGIHVLDHLIVTSEGFMSIRESFPDYFSGSGF